MRRAILFAASLLLAAFALSVVLLAQDDSSETVFADDDTPPRSDSGFEADAGSSSDIVSSNDHPAPSAQVRLARVDRLADGDSFDIVWLDTGESDEVRLFGINAPEGDACFGDGARDILDTLTSDQELLIESIERDGFGRVLGNVWVADVFVNLRLVELGAALALTDSSQHGEAIRQAQTTAQANGSGLWNAASCGASDQAQLLIAEIFENAPGPDNENPNGEWIDIFNAGDSAADLTNWSIRDESTRHRFFFPDDFTLEAGQTVRVFSGCGHDDATSLYWCDGDPVWNNGGDTAFLVNPDGGFVDRKSVV